MEYCAGGSLALQIKDPRVSFPIARIIRILFGVARGMFHLHKSNIVHRDLAARNVLLTKDGEPKLSVSDVISFVLFCLLLLINQYKYHNKFIIY